MTKRCTVLGLMPPAGVERLRAAGFEVEIVADPSTVNVAASVRTAAARGWGIISAPFIHTNQIKTHWTALQEGAASAGLEPSGAGRRCGHTIVVAPSDPEAKIYPPSGSSKQDGHEFCVRGVATRGPDALRFIEIHGR